MPPQFYLHEFLFIQHIRLPGFRSGTNADWGNLSSCMNTVIKPPHGYHAFFRPRNCSEASDLIQCDMENRETFGDCKSFNFLGMCNPPYYYNTSCTTSFLVSAGNEMPRHPASDEIIHLKITPRPRCPSHKGSPISTPGSQSGVSTPAEPMPNSVPDIPSSAESPDPSPAAVCKIDYDFLYATNEH